MQGSVSEDPRKDQRNNSSMEDSTAMTIEFLRARLLSERSVSRTARQRADQLAKRVVELEEQLRTVTSQRKKAEQAAVQVLAILKNHGINDISEAFDSNSDQDEVVSESKGSDNSIKEQKNHLTSEFGGTEIQDGLSSSEHEASSTPSRSLSWKSGSGNPNYQEKEKLPQARRRHSSVLSTSLPSPRKRPGKSCRQIKCRDTSDEVVEVRDTSPDGVAAETGEVAIHFEGRSEISNGGAPSGEEKILLDDLGSHSQTNQRKENGSSQDEKGDRNIEMETALEQQAQLIVRFQAEENAQREWEQRYKEGNGGIADLSEPGNQSDLTEERSTPKLEAMEAADIVSSFGTVLKSKEDVHGGEEMNSRISQDFSPTNLGAHNHDEPHRSTSNEFRIYSEDFTSKEGREYAGAWVGKQGIQGNSFAGENVFGSELKPHASEIRASSIPGLDWSMVKYYRGESSSNEQHPNPSNMNQATSHGLGSVLEALQVAKLSLHEELRKSSQGKDAATIPDNQIFPATKADGSMEAPPGSASLFRLPTESQSFHSSQIDFQRRHSDMGLSLARFPELGPGLGVGQRNLTYPPYTDFSGRGRMSPGRSYSASYLDAATVPNSYGKMSPAASYHYPDPVRMRPSSSAYYHADLRTGVAPHLDPRAELPEEQRFSVYDNGMNWWNMQR